MLWEGLMSFMIESLGLGHLDNEDRIRLAQELWISVVESDASDDPTAILTEDQIRELDRRIEAFERDPSRGAPWDEVRARLRRHES